MKTQHALALALGPARALMICLIFLFASCAAIPLVPLVTKVATVIAQITGVVDLIESQAQVASGTGLLPPQVAKAITAVRDVVTRINDEARRSPASLESVIAEFERLYADLVQVVAPLGVRAVPSGGRLSAPPPGTVQVPTTAELGELLRESARDSER